jgi:antitoxin (DNA-binding transcriptional repressor) of toxin-antitoxin stability system
METTMSEPVRAVGVRQFRDHATEYLSGGEPIAVTRHGRVIGFYLPVPPDDTEAQRAFARLDAAVEQIRNRSGLSEEELSTLVDLRTPAAG